METKFQSKSLSRLGNAEDYAIYRAGLEWDLTEPIVIESEQDFRSTPRWRERLNPYHHQVSNLITFCRRLPVTLLADDVGLGKTISAGLIISELAARGRLSKILIVCPKLLCPQWKEELETKFNVPGTVAIGKGLLDADHEEMGAVITTYNSARLYLDRIPKDRFDMLILDEAHKLRNLYGVEKTPQVAKSFHGALQDRRFRFVLMLTATPIQNRLWDLYSLVDLLTVARGHENPFGKPGMFARRFIADDTGQARQLKASARDEFRSIVYGYMSRVRRGDAQLAFPTRVVQMHPLKPTTAELQLIDVIAKPIQKMNRLAQISILQALASSPDALSAQLANMARKGTAPQELALAVKQIVDTMPTSAKLEGLGTLIDNLKKQDPDSWRLVIFTTRRETQTTIQSFLEKRGLSVGLINGDSGQRNQETIARFRQSPPDCRVIVSTEAGSEGVNLQVANVLVNFDLPWNPMIVEQRIGRVQRLASVHEKVSIFNIMLKGTFEEYIVGRLTEKLQMAAHAIGDIESLLRGADIDGDGEPDDADTFEDRVLELVLAALAKRNVERDVQLATESIERAKEELKREENNINSLLGSMDGAGYVGPRAPTLPPVQHSMEPKDFTLSALRMLGASVKEEVPGIFLAESNDRRERIRFEDGVGAGQAAILYGPQTSAFQRLVDRSIATGIHNVTDADTNVAAEANRLVREWMSGFEAKELSISASKVRRSFNGSALLRIRATVAHDSYERLVSVDCKNSEHSVEQLGQEGLVPLPKTIKDMAVAGVDRQRLIAASESDDAIAEFRRFYEERRELEMKAAGEDERKRKKLEDDFTPRLEMTLVGLEGTMHRDAVMKASFEFESGGRYESEITVLPQQGQILSAPKTDLCTKTGKMVPETCLARCEVTGAKVLQHLLSVSEASGRRALPEFIAVCAFSGKKVLNDELEISSTTGQAVAASLMRTSAISGKRAEPNQFDKCAFTGADVLKTELGISAISGKIYRIDEQQRSQISGKVGHASEFIACPETKQMMAANEAETCEVTHQKVMPGILLSCELTGKRALPSCFASCVVTNKRVLKNHLVTSSISQAYVLKDEAVRSGEGKFCLPSEAQSCFWSDRRCHPDDLRSCSLTGLPIHVEFLAGQFSPKLRPLSELLEGMRRNTDGNEVWDRVAGRVTSAVKGRKCRIEAGIMSPSRRYLATCAESKTMLGFRVSHIGAIYDLNDNSIVGRLAEGKRAGGNWKAR
ncbi:SNF2-related protein [Bradyrhizobium sp. CCGUVB14]|uniref:SNF2-related protein n=1 Tax=Bradyrhizobium sp. CCGUVB14 TaxID=2949628 RepID=UPI0020B2AED1|nr:SNF2-related protein [Bradyrhizobium sp. CCGUVB14]MCP3447315.1 SNF2-related protein [Bradyrhizobium sp. CCGUVB14]